MSSQTTSVMRSVWRWGRVARIRAVTTALLVAGCTVLAKAQEAPLPPRPNTLVNDYAGVLAPGNEAALERKLVAYDDSTGTQIAIVIERYLESGDAFTRSLEIAESWGVGGAEDDNGILVYVAVDNRKVFIQTGYGAEGYVTDILANRIIEQVIAPNFRAGNYYAGLDKATTIMTELLSGQYQADPNRRVGQGGMSPLTVIMLLFLIILVIRWLSQRGGGGDDEDGGYHRGGRYRGPRGRRGGGWVILPGGGFGGGGFGGGGFGGGGGGFGGFGGGGFGGGGAGGSW